MYEDDDKNCNRMVQHARACYLPLCDLLLKLIRRHEGAFKVSLAVSGTTLDLFEQYVPEAMDGLKALADTGCVEFIGETQYHTFAHFYAHEEFARQVKEHAARIKELFGKKPTTFLNAELIYNNDLSVLLSRLGFKAALSEYLPKYMIPVRYIVLSELPMLPNGKLDRKSMEKIAAEDGD